MNTPKHSGRYKSVKSKSNSSPTSFSRSGRPPKMKSHRGHKYIKNGSASISRRQQRDLTFQYKLFGLREIVQQMTSQSSTIYDQKNKSTLITYYQSIASAQEFLDELEHRFLSVLPIEEDDKALRPYISDTDSVSERHFKAARATVALAAEDLELDENACYDVQVRVIDLLTLWMKEYFVCDFEEQNLTDRLKQLLHRIKDIRSKPILPDLPWPSVPASRPSHHDEILAAGDDDDDDDAIYAEIVKQNHSSDIVIQTTNKSGHGHGKFAFSDQVHPFNDENEDEDVKHTVQQAQPKQLISSPNDNSMHSLRSEQMEQIATVISPMRPFPALLFPENAVNEEEKFVDVAQPLPSQQFEHSMVVLSTKNNAFYLPRTELYFVDDKCDEYFLSRCVVLLKSTPTLRQQQHQQQQQQQQPETFKVMLTNICDFGDIENDDDDDTTNSNSRTQLPLPPMQSQPKSQSQLQPTQPTQPTQTQLLHLHANKLQFKPSPNGHSTEDSDFKQCNREVTENMVSTPNATSDEFRDRDSSLHSAQNKNEDSQKSMSNHSKVSNHNNNPVAALNAAADASTPHSAAAAANDLMMEKRKTNFLYVQQDVSRRYCVRDPLKYKDIADKLEKLYYKLSKEAPFSRRKKRHSSSANLTMSEGCQLTSHLGSSLTGSKRLRDVFHDSIAPLKDDFQNKVKNEVFAQQLTMMTFKTFQRVRKRELMDQNWKCKDRLELAANLCQLIDHFNCLSKFVQITILHCADVNKRGRMIKKFIKIMDELLKLNNFQSLCAVYGAITSSPIYSLAAAWRQIKAKHRLRFEVIKTYFVTTHNMANLRQLHKERPMPMIPYTGIYLQDLIQSEERFKERMFREQLKAAQNGNLKEEQQNIQTVCFTYDFSGSGLVLFDHLTRMSKQIDIILNYTETGYTNITDDHIVQNFILSEFAEQATFTDDDIHKISEDVRKADGL